MFPSHCNPKAEFEAKLWQWPKNGTGAKLLAPLRPKDSPRPGFAGQ